MPRLLFVLACVVALSLRSAPAAPIPADGGGVVLRTVRYQGKRFDVVIVDLGRARLDLHLQTGLGRLGALHAVRDRLRAEGRNPVAITNAGIFGADAPVGLHVERGRTLHPLARGDGWGNFFLRPNGVFFVDRAGAHVEETGAFARRKRTSRVRLATQSGPLLLRRGAIHPKFRPGSKNALLRSGIGVRADKTVVIVVSLDPVTFHDFATLFRDVLDCPDALYLDGTISRLWAPALGRGGDASGYMGILSVSTAGPGRGARDAQHAQHAQHER